MVNKPLSGPGVPYGGVGWLAIIQRWQKNADCFSSFKGSQRSCGHQKLPKKSVSSSTFFDLLEQIEHHMGGLFPYFHWEIRSFLRMDFSAISMKTPATSTWCSQMQHVLLLRDPIFQVSSTPLNIGVLVHVCFSFYRANRANRANRFTKWKPRLKSSNLNEDTI